MYREPNATPDAWRQREELVLARIAATHATVRTQHWFSHESAALLWGCDIWRLTDRVDLTQLGNPRVRQPTEPHLSRHWTSLPEGDRTEACGIPTTSLERTVVDCARTLDPRRGLVIADSALRIGTRRAVLDDVLRRAVGLRGVRRARRVLELADGAAESPGETLTRHALLAEGIPAAALQHPVPTRLGVFWVDFAWVGARVIVEFDGFVKYGALASGGAARAVFEEKRRQDALEEAGWIVIRVTWADLDNPPELARRVRQAFARASK